MKLNFCSHLFLLLVTALPLSSAQRCEASPNRITRCSDMFQTRRCTPICPLGGSTCGGLGNQCFTDCVFPGCSCFIEQGRCRSDGLPVSNSERYRLVYNYWQRFLSFPCLTSFSSYSCVGTPVRCDTIPTAAQCFSVQGCNWISPPVPSPVFQPALPTPPVIAPAVPTIDGPVPTVGIGPEDPDGFCTGSGIFSCSSLFAFRQCVPQCPNGIPETCTGLSNQCFGSCTFPGCGCNDVPGQCNVDTGEIAFLGQLRLVSTVGSFGSLASVLNVCFFFLLYSSAVSAFP